MYKDIYKKFFNKFPYTLQFSGIITLFLLVIYGILYLFSSLIIQSITSLMYSFLGIFNFLFAILILSILFNLISPFIYSYFASNSVLETSRKDDVTVKNFMKTYLIGWHQPLKGQLSMYNTLFISLLTFIGVNLLLSSIVYLSLYNLNVANYKPAFDELIRIMNLATQEEFIEQLAVFASSSYAKTLMIPAHYINFVSLFFALYIFIHKINLNVFKYYLTNIMIGISARGTHLVFKTGLKQCKKSFYKDYYKNLFPLTLLYIVIVSVSYFSLSLIPQLDGNSYVLNITTVLIVFMLLIPFMPISFNLYNEMYPKYSSYFLDSFINIAKNQLQAMKQNYRHFNELEQVNIKRSEENLNKIQEEINKSKETQNEVKDENNEDTLKNDDQNKDSE